MTHHAVTDDAMQAKLKTLLSQNRSRVRELVKAVQDTVIDDYTREPLDILFSTANPNSGDVLEYPETVVIGFDRAKRDYYKIHPHALSQIGARLQIDAGYVRKLNLGSEDNWRRALLTVNLNRLMYKSEFAKRGEGPMRFLLRFVGDELRGFMSRSYGRHLASKPMLAAFLAACNEAGAEPTDAMATAVKNTLSCYLPVVFAPTPGDHVAVGVRWANSDFGAGRLTVSLALLSIARGTSVVLSDEYAKVHIGSIIPEGDLEISDATATKEVEAAASAIKDAVDNLLKPASVQRLMNAIERAREQKVEWVALRRDLKKFLYEEELGSIEDSVVNGRGFGSLPHPGVGANGEPLPTKWWAMNILALLADQVPDVERKIELQQEAGKFLEVKVGAKT